MAGYEITTNTQIIKLGIDTDHRCCERYGYFLSKDEISDFIGAKLVGINITDTALNSDVLENVGDLYDGDVMFVNLETDKGTLQFVAYNSHNGYYGHDAIVISEQIKHETTL